MTTGKRIRFNYYLLLFQHGNLVENCVKSMFTHGPADANQLISAGIGIPSNAINHLYHELDHDKNEGYGSSKNYDYCVAYDGNTTDDANCVRNISEKRSTNACLCPGTNSYSVGQPVKQSSPGIVQPSTTAAPRVPSELLYQ